MSFSITDARSELAAMLHGTTLDQVENVNGIFNRAARQLLLDIDPAETKRFAPLATPVFYNVFNYALPDDLKGNKIVDIIPPSSNNVRDKFTQGYNQAFDMFKKNNVNNFTIINNSGKKFIRIAYANQAQNTLINACNSLTSNGTFTANLFATNLQENNLITDNGQSMLSYDQSAGVGVIQTSNQQAVDLSTHYNNGVFFLDFYQPATTLYQITIRVGSANNKYYEGIATTQYDGTPFVAGMNTIGIEWKDMTSSNSPDKTKITHIAVFSYANAATYQFAVGQLYNNLGFLFNVEYYSKYLFSNASNGVWQEKVLTDDDLINLDTDSYNLFLYQAAFLCVQQALGQDAGYDTNIFLDKYNQGLSRYKRMYKSEIQKPQITYYNKPRQGYNGLIGSRIKY